MDQPNSPKELWPLLSDRDSPPTSPPSSPKGSWAAAARSSCNNDDNGGGGGDWQSETDLGRTGASSWHSFDVERAGARRLPFSLASAEAWFGDRALGVLWVLAATTMFSMASVFVKLCRRIPAVETGLVRSIYSVVLGGGLCKFVFKRELLPLSTGSAVLALLVGRSLVDWAASNLFYVGCSILPLGLATVIMFTSPFWAAVLASMWLGEPYSRTDFALACVAFLGVVLSAFPSMSPESGTNSPGLASILLVFPCSFFQAATYCFIRRLGGRVHFMQMTVCYGICGLVIAPSLMLLGAFQHEELMEPAPISARGRASTIFLASSVAFFAIGGQVFLNLGCAKVESSVAALIHTLDIPLALLFQGLVFGQQAKAAEVAGAVVVTLACTSLAVLKRDGQSKPDSLD